MIVMSINALSLMAIWSPCIPAPVPSSAAPRAARPPRTIHDTASGHVPPRPLRPPGPDLQRRRRGIIFSGSDVPRRPLTIISAAESLNDEKPHPAAAPRRTPTALPHEAPCDARPRPRHAPEDLMATQVEQNY